MNDIQLTSEMKEVFRLILESDKHIYVTGKAGTGKSTLLKVMAATPGIRMLVTGSTGIAAVNAGGCTLHSLLKIPHDVISPNAPIRSKLNENTVRIVNAVDFLVIDEMSMIRPDVLDYADRVLRIMRGHDVPFGGLRLIMFGDLYQLPPVVKRDEEVILRTFYRGCYFFYADTFREKGFHTVTLNHIFRQSDERFIEILNNIRDFRPTEGDIEDLCARRNMRKSKQFDNGSVHLCALRSEAEEINRKMLGEPERTYPAITQGDFAPAAMPCESLLKIRKGARVMMTVNNRQLGFYNGSLGHVLNLEDDCIDILLDNGTQVSVKRYNWVSYDFQFKDGEVEKTEKGNCSQFPVALAWAITIHKSQGLTFDKVTVHARNIFASGQLYVALSRCRTMEGVVLDSFIRPEHIVADLTLYKFEKACQTNGGMFDKDTYRLMRRK